MSKENQQKPWERTGFIMVETATADGLLEGVTEVLAVENPHGMRLRYSNGETGKAILHGVDINTVRNFIYRRRALHDSRLKLGDRVDEYDRRVSTLNVVADGKAERLDILIQGKRVARLWIEQNTEILPVAGEHQVEIYVEPVDGARTSVQYTEGSRMAREPMKMIRPPNEMIIALTLPLPEKGDTDEG